VKIGQVDPEIICVKEFISLKIKMRGCRPTTLLNSGVTAPKLPDLHTIMVIAIS